MCTDRKTVLSEIYLCTLKSAAIFTYFTPGLWIFTYFTPGLCIFHDACTNEQRSTLLKTLRVPTCYIKLQGRRKKQVRILLNIMFESPFPTFSFRSAEGFIIRLEVNYFLFLSLLLWILFCSLVLSNGCDFNRKSLKELLGNACSKILRRWKWRWHRQTVVMMAIFAETTHEHTHTSW